MRIKHISQFTETDMDIPDQITEITVRIQHRLHEATITIDAPLNSQGVWFIDVKLREHAVAVQWKHDCGYGITDSPDSKSGYGEGAQEEYKDVDSVVNRISALLVGK